MAKISYNEATKKKGQIELKAYTVNEQVFEEILTFGYRVRIIEDREEFNSYKYGYPQKSLITYDGFKTMILLECVLNDHFDLGERMTHWKQCILYKEVTQEAPVQKTITGGMAKRIMESKILKYYTPEEYEQRLNMFAAQYDETLIQFHYEIEQKKHVIVKYDNCYKYDINGAHNDALRIIFPKAAQEFEKMYAERKINPINKQIVNFYVGVLALSHRQTYNWIVQRVTKQLKSAINYCEDLFESDLIYANTDGFIIQNPAKLIDTSTELGQFKLEYHGDVYLYKDDNYWCYQTDNEIKGSIMYEPRKHIDLKNNKVVHYDQVKIKNAKVYVAQNIVEEILL